MNKAIKDRADMLEVIIKHDNRVIDTRVENFKQRVAEGDREYILNFAKEDIEEIERLYNEMVETGKQRQVLMWALEQEEE